MNNQMNERIRLEGRGGIAPEIETAWQSETRHRVAEIQSGQAKGIPLDEALAEARKRVGL
ncbi:addiction module protein [Synoicihabitans lomoniglobus]|nr:addiction module protein [Opitutaceae bacterium LMO-M01]